MTERRFHLGTMGWSYDFWIGNFYPADTKPQDFLVEYAKHFSTVEIDNTFYRNPSEHTVKKWKSQTPPDFLFSAKFPQRITHEKVLRASKDDLEFFIRNISFLDEKLGPLLLQFPYSFKIEEFDVLKDFISILPKEYGYVVEVKHKSWLEERFYRMLRENNVALATTDTPWMPEFNEVTADFTYLRWEGNRKKIKGTTGKVERERNSEIVGWAEKIKALLTEGVEVFGYFSKYYSGHSPTDAKLLLDSLSCIG
jgi:uncharacterized protein YecE (DUF72 family)